MFDSKTRKVQLVAQIRHPVKDKPSGFFVGMIFLQLFRTYLCYSCGEAVRRHIEPDQSEPIGYGRIPMHRQQRSTAVGQQAHHSGCGM